MPTVMNRDPNISAEMRIEEVEKRLAELEAENAGLRARLISSPSGDAEESK